MLTPIQEQAARFERLEEHDVKALVVLGLIDKYTTENAMKSLSFALRHDAVIIERRMSAWTASQNEARAANADPDWNDRDAWYHIGDDEFIALDVVEAMNAEERAELRARIG